MDINTGFVRDAHGVENLFEGSKGKGTKKASAPRFSSGDFARGVSDHMLRAAAGTWAHAGEGGTRVTAFVAGGLIPPNLRGTSSGAKLVIIADVSNPARSARLQLHVHVGDLRVRLMPRRG